MPVTETVTIINRSGKVVSTGKQLVNIFKDAKEAYLEKKSEIRAEYQHKLEYKQAQKLLAARATADDTRSMTSSRRRRHRDRDAHGVSRPPVALTERNLSQIDEQSVQGSTAGSVRRSRSQHGSRAGSRAGGSNSGYRTPYVEDGIASQHPNLTRRHTDFPTNTQLPTTAPPPYSSQLTRSRSDPDLRSDDIDMNLAYGSLPLELQVVQTQEQKEAELAATMSKLDNLLLEAQCMHHSASAIIKNLQENPEAMAAVALTLAELSNILTKMSPAILTALKSSSPAVFALLASPQFLIAGGVALGVTVVMFGGYKIVKKLQASQLEKKEANRMEEALVWDAGEMGSIESWRRGISAVDGAGDEVASQATSVDGEFITPEAARQKKERIRERRREERVSGWKGEGSVKANSVSGGSVRSERRGDDDGSTVRGKEVSSKTASTVAPSESGRSRKGKESVVKEKERKKKPSALSVIFSSKSKDKDSKGKGKDKESSVGGKSHRPKMIEL